MTREVEVSSISILKLPFKTLKLTGFDIMSYTKGKTRRESLIESAKSAYFCFYCVNLLVCHVLQTIFLFTSYEDLNVSINVLSGVINMTVLQWKLLTVWRHKTIIVEIFYTLGVTDFNLAPQKLRLKVSKVLKGFKVFEVCQFVALSLTTLSFCLMPVVKYFLNEVWYSDLPWDFWLPFDRFDKNYYNFVYLWINWMFINVIFLFFSLDMIIYGMIVMISVHFIILNYYIRETPNEVSKLSERHVNLICLVHKLNDLFSPSLLLNFIGSSIVICVAAFLLASSNQMIELINYGFLLQMLMGQIFLLCYLGNLLKTSSLSLRNSIYSSNWYGKNDKKITIGLQLMLMQAQQPSQVTAWKFTALNYETFTTVLNATYSYYMLLRSIVSK